MMGFFRRRIPFLICLVIIGIAGYCARKSLQPVSAIIHGSLIGFSYGISMGATNPPPSPENYSFFQKVRLFLGTATGSAYADKEDGCVKAGGSINIALKSGEIAETSFQVPNAYLSKNYRPIDPLSGKPEKFISLEALLKDFHPICRTADYATHDSRAYSKLVIRLDIHPGAPEGLRNIYRRYLESEYTEFVETDELGFKIYEGSADRHNLTGGKKLLIPPKDYLKNPIILTCGKARDSTDKLFSSCKVRAQYTPFLHVEYSFKPSPNFENLKEIDSRVDAFLGTLITKQTKLSDERIVSFDQEFCKGDFIARLGIIELAVPRDTDIYLLNGERLWGTKHPRYGCDINRVEGVVTLESDPYVQDSYSISIPSGKNGEHKTEYDRFNVSLGREKDFTDLPSGVRKKRFRLYKHYLLPLDRFPTANKQPIFIDCDQHQDNTFSPNSPDWCHSAYFHTSGLFVEHKFRIRDESDDEIAEMEMEKIKLVNSFIQKAQDQSPLP